MDFEQLSRYLPEIEASIRRSFTAAKRGSDPRFHPAIDRLAEFALRGGKRFRALLVLGGYHLATGRPPTPALPAAAALEHFQSWMLIHDDIIDHSEVRRGGPTVHRGLTEEFQRRGGLGDPTEYGVGMGITLGDLEEPFTVDGLLSCPVGLERRQRALGEYVRMTRETAFGQLLDIRNGTVPPSQLREDDILLVHRLKSAVYTVASPLRIGAYLGGGPPGLVKELDAVGTDLGVAFQLRDDVLGAGFVGAASGKSANDLVEGKRTLLVLEAWSRATPPERSALDRVLGHADAKASEVEAAREVIRSTGSLGYSEQKIRSLTDRALRRVSRSRQLRPEGKELLRDVARRLVDRTV